MSVDAKMNTYGDEWRPLALNCFYEIFPCSGFSTNLLGLGWNDVIAQVW